MGAQRYIRLYRASLIILFLALVVFFYGPARAQNPDNRKAVKEAIAKQPEIFIQPAVFDFGKVSKRKSFLSANFKLTNKGKAILLVRNIRSLCGCLTVSYQTKGQITPYFGTEGAPLGWLAQLSPGETAQLVALLNLNHSSIKKGKLYREAEIVSNDPLNPVMDIRLTAQLRD